MLNLVLQHLADVVTETHNKKFEIIDKLNFAAITKPDYILGSWIENDNNIQSKQIYKTILSYDAEGHYTYTPCDDNCDTLMLDDKLYHINVIKDHSCLQLAMWLSSIGLRHHTHSLAYVLLNWQVDRSAIIHKGTIQMVNDITGFDEKKNILSFIEHNGNKCHDLRSILTDDHYNVKMLK